MSTEGSGPALPEKPGETETEKKEKPETEKKEKPETEKKEKSDKRSSSSLEKPSSSRHVKRKSVHSAIITAQQQQELTSSMSSGEPSPPGEQIEPTQSHHHERSTSNEEKRHRRDSSGKVKPPATPDRASSDRSKRKQPVAACSTEEQSRHSSSATPKRSSERSNHTSSRSGDHTSTSHSSSSHLSAHSSGHTPSHTPGHTPSHTPGHSPTRGESKKRRDSSALSNNGLARSEGDASSADSEEAHAKSGGESDSAIEDIIVIESDVSREDSGKDDKSVRSNESSKSEGGKGTPSMPAMTPAKKKRFPALLSGGRNVSFAGPNDPVVYVKQRPMAGLFIQKQGVMLKKSQKTGRWKKRYVVVTPQQLCCFKDAADSGEPEMAIDLQYAGVRPRVTHDLKPGFDVVSTDGTLSLMALDSVTTQEWFTHITAAIEHLVEQSAANVGGASSSGVDESQHSDETSGSAGGSLDKNKEALMKILARPENRLCADCSRPDPQWASTNLGSFVCITCSGIHRGLGVHITKIRSVSMDTWTAEQVAGMASKGNWKVNEYYLATLPENVKPPTPDTPIDELKQFLHDKYVALKYVPEEDKGKAPQYSASSVPTMNISQSYISSDDVFHQKAKSASSQLQPPTSTSNVGSGRRSLTLDQHLMFMAALRDDVVFRAELQRFIFHTDDGAVFKQTLLNAIEKDEAFKEKLKKALLE